MTDHRPPDNDNGDPYPVAPLPLGGAGRPPDVAATRPAPAPAPGGSGYPRAPYGQVAPAYGRSPYPQPGAVPPGYAQAPVQVVYVQAPAVGPDGKPLKSKVAAGLLAFFVGTLGVHNFYLGQTWRGIAHVALTVVPTALVMVFAVAGLGDLDLGGPPDEHLFGAWLGVLVYGYWFSLILMPILGVNQIWAYVEAVIILTSKDPSLR